MEIRTKLTPYETAAIAHEAFLAHPGRCAECRKRCNCAHCHGREADLCPRARRLLEVAGERISEAMAEES